MADNTDEARLSLQAKQDYYDGLEQMLNSDDDNDKSHSDAGRHSSMQAMQKAAARKREQSASKHNATGPGVPRSISDSNLMRKKEHPPTASSDPNNEHPTSSTGANKLPPSLASRHTFSGTTSKESAVPSSALPKAIGKRKRESSIKQLPPDQQIFQDLKFYFFPNTDAHPGRRMRIHKAIEFGATWQKDFSDSVTHIIADKSMEYASILKFLKKDSVSPHAVVVSESYPAECITHRTLLDPKRLQFRVKGYDTPADASRPASSGSERSLHIKPAGKSVQTKQPETQSTKRSARSSPSQTHISDDENDNEAQHDNVMTDFNIHSTKEFDDAIRKAKDLKHVPLDTDDEPSSRPSSSEGSTTDDEEESPAVASLGKKKNQAYSFQCMEAHNGSKSETPNAATVAVLQQMADYYGQIGDEWRLRAYRQAMSTLRKHPTKVWTSEEARTLPKIGERLATKIEEIAFTNRLRRLDNAKAEPRDQTLQTFMQVYGAGFAKASEWVSAGYQTLDEVLEKADVTDNQRIGIEHYEDFNSRIPRSEVEQHGNIVRRTLQKIDPKFEVIVGGSYRRGSTTSGDIDCIITQPETGGAHIRQVVLEQLVPKLFAKKFLVAELAATSRDDGSKWHGAATIPPVSSSTKPNPWRRIDFMLVASDEIGAALIAFTGNDIFNRSLRLLASTKGMRLNQRGLYKDAIRGKGRVKLSEGVLVEGKDEKKIFEILSVPWRPPEQRIC